MLQIIVRPHAARSSSGSRCKVSPQRSSASSSGLENPTGQEEKQKKLVSSVIVTTSDGLHSRSDGLQPTSHGLHLVASS